MANTIYASFADPTMAERAAGALLDFGVRPEDLTVVRSSDAAVQNVEGGATMPPKTGESISRTDYTTTVAEDNVRTGAVTDMTVDDTDLADKNLRSNAAMGTSVTDDIRMRRDEASIRSRDAMESNPSDYVPDDSDEDVDSTAVGEIGHTNDGWSDGADGATDRDMSRDYDASRASDDRDSEDRVAGIEKSAKEGISTTTGADAGVGAAKGAGWGLGVGILAALASIAVPGVGLVLGGGALAAALGGLVATTGAGAVAGAVTGYLKDQGVEEHVAQDYQKTVEQGGAMLAVSLPSGPVDEAKGRDILSKYGATNLNAYAGPAARGYMA